MACALLALLLAAPASDAAAPQISLDEYPAKEIDAIPEPYRTWATEEVVYLMTPAEFEVFLRLDSELKYQTFMEDFWEVRDPTPGTPQNEFKDVHYERLEYADRIYGRSSPRPGWQTDRGKMHILLGPPQQITRTPSEMLTYPTEVWFYAVDPATGLPPFFYLLFYQRYGAGDYELYSPLSDGPQKLLNGAGIREVEQRMERFSQGPSRGFAPTGYDRDAEAVYSILIEINHDLASAAFSYYPSEAGMEFGVTPLATEMLIADLDRVAERIMPDPTWAYNVLTGITESDVRFETLEVDATAAALIDIDGEPFIHFATQTRGEQLNVGEYDGAYYFSFRANGSIVTADTEVLQNFEATMSGDLEEEQARRFTSNPFLYLDIVPTLPGQQSFSIMLENTVARSFGREEFDLRVPASHPEQPQIAGPVVALDVQRREFDPFSERFAFQYRDLAMVPSVDRQVDLGRPFHVFQQVLLPADHGTPVTLRYSLTEPSGSAVREESVRLEASAADEHGVIPHLWTVDTAGLGAGEYRLRLTLDENPAARASVALRLRQPSGAPARPFVNAQQAPPPSDVEIALERAAQYRTVGELEAAGRWLEYAAARAPEDAEVQTRYVDLLEEAGHNERLVEVLMPIAARDPRNTDALGRLARAHSRLGEHYDAIRYYERIRLVTDEEDPELLNALAVEYDAEGNTEKVREILELSLDLAPDQPEIRRMLDRITVPASTPRG